MAATSHSSSLVPVQPAFTDAGRLALAGYLAGYRGLTREAYTLDLRQFTGWCRTRSLPLFSVRRADIETWPPASAHLRSRGSEVVPWKAVWPPPAARLTTARNSAQITTGRGHRQRSRTACAGVGDPSLIHTDRPNWAIWAGRCEAGMCDGDVATGRDLGDEVLDALLEQSSDAGGGT
jgi:hypothetical protein